MGRCDKSRKKRFKDLKIVLKWKKNDGGLVKITFHFNEYLKIYTYSIGLYIDLILILFLILGIKKRKFVDNAKLIMQRFFKYSLNLGLWFNYMWIILHCFYEAFVLNDSISSGERQNLQRCFYQTTCIKNKCKYTKRKRV